MQLRDSLLLPHPAAGIIAHAQMIRETFRNVIKEVAITYLRSKHLNVRSNDVYSPDKRTNRRLSRRTGARTSESPIGIPREAEEADA